MIGASRQWVHQEVVNGRIAGAPHRLLLQGLIPISWRNGSGSNQSDSLCCQALAAQGSLETCILIFAKTPNSQFEFGYRDLVEISLVVVASAGLT